jgi:hypothetical protein
MARQTRSRRHLHRVALTRGAALNRAAFQDFFRRTTHVCGVPAGARGHTGPVRHNRMGSCLNPVHSQEREEFMTIRSRLLRHIGLAAAVIAVPAATIASLAQAQLDDRGCRIYALTDVVDRTNKGSGGGSVYCPPPNDPANQLAITVTLYRDGDRVAADQAVCSPPDNLGCADSVARFCPLWAAQLSPLASPARNVAIGAGYRQTTRWAAIVAAACDASCASSHPRSRAQMQYRFLPWLASLPVRRCPRRGARRSRGGIAGPPSP